MQPMRNKDIRKKWLVAQLEDMDIPNFSVHDNLRKVLLSRGGYGMEVFFYGIGVAFIHGRMIPKFKELAGHCGTAQCLSDEEVGQRLVKDMAHTNFKASKANVVGDLATASAIVNGAMAFQGDPSSNPPTRRQKRMGQQAIQIVTVAQTVAVYDFKKSKAPSDSDDEEKATAT